MNARFAIIIFFLLPFLIKAQVFQVDKPALSIDSLKKVLPLLHGSAKVDCLNELARSYMEDLEKMNAAAAVATAREAYIEAAAIDYIKGIGDACLQLGLISYWHSWDFFESEKKYRQAILWHQKIQDNNGLGFGFRGVGSSLIQQGYADKAMEALGRSAFYFRKAGNRIMLADLNDWFSYAYELKGNFEKRFECVTKGFQEKKRINDTRGIIWSYYNLAQIYQSVEDYETALDYLRQSFQQASKQAVNWQAYRSMGYLFLAMGNYDSSIYYFHQMLRVKPLDGSALAGLGKLYLLRKQYHKALYFLQHALMIKKRIDPGRALLVLIDLGKTYTGLKQYAKALQYARECLTIASETENKPAIQSAYEIYWQVYQHLKNTDSAYIYLQRYVTLKDSLQDARARQHQLQKLLLYKVEAKEAQQQAKILLLHKDNQIKHQQLQRAALLKKILAGSLAAFVLLSLFIFKNVSLKRKNEKHRRELAENELQLQKLESQRIRAEWKQQTSQLKIQALQAQMNPHFIFNSLNCINRFILRKQSREATEYLTKFSRLIRMVLHSSDNTTISLAEDLEALQLYLDLESLRFGQKFMYHIACDPEMDTGFIQLPPMLIQPYVENAIWHGLMLKEGDKHVWINLAQEAGLLICTITDNGIGRKKANELKRGSSDIHKSMGMRITADRIALLQQKGGKASLQIHDLVLPDGNAGGTEIIIKLPIAYD